MKRQKRAYTWEELSGDCQALAVRVRRLRRDEGFNPTTILAVARSGMPPATLLAYHLGIRAVTAVAYQKYHGRRAGKIRRLLPFPLQIPSEHKQVLVVDSVADSGETLAAVGADLLARHFEYREVVLHYKPCSKVLPYLYQHKTSDWVVYPWEVK